VLFIIWSTLSYGQRDVGFSRAIESYFLNNKTDAIEGLYTISDKTVVSYPWYYSSSNDTIDHNYWAKVVIIKDSTNLTRNYYELVIEAEGFEAKKVRAEFLKIKDSPLLFASKQIDNQKKNIYATRVFEFVKDEEKLFAQYQWEKGGVIYKRERTYMKYYPK